MAAMLALMIEVEVDGAKIDMTTPAFKTGVCGIKSAALPTEVAYS
ncbi:MAG TPA: hypothetical protein VNF45_08770 [Candidatus Binataceae bacterium]|nr:hypothetical protein [Candidatus Binataceae bacterium]